MSLGARIASMRGYRRLNQEELGGRVGVAKQTLRFRFAWKCD